MVINEILFNPPGSDAPNEYIELRGTPNDVLPAGTYFVALDGDTNGLAGSIRHTVDLSGQAIGGNGFLVLLQNGNSYTVNSNATILVNTNGPGWGDGSSSSIGYRGDGGRTDLENASVTFLLIQTTHPPVLGDDIDPNKDGIPDGPVWASWTVWDSVGILDNDGFGDIAYGAINFRRYSAPGNTATASGTVYPVNFTPSYVARVANSTGSTVEDWTAGDSLAGNAPAWTLSASTVPVAYQGLPLNHIGSPNFGAPKFDGVVAIQSGGNTTVGEGGATDSYQLCLNTTPSGPVLLEITASGALQISTDGGATWGASRTLSLGDTAQHPVRVRAVDDNVVDTSPHWGTIRHRIMGTADPTRYPLTALGPTVNVAIADNDSLLLTELKVNPPGTNDGPYEFVEISGPPNALLTNVYFLALQSSASKNPGKVELAMNLSSARLGSDGLLVIGAPSNPYGIPGNTTLFGDPRFESPDGVLDNGSMSFLLVASPQPIVEGTDLDAGDNGYLEGLPAGTTILDSVAWFAGDTNDVLFSDAVLLLEHGIPDAATRYPGDLIPNDSEAWFYGNLLDTGGATLAYDSDKVSLDFPRGTLLTPGALNNTAPTVNALPALSGVIGDPTNPNTLFAVDDAETPVNRLTVSATSTNQAVVPDANLVITPGANGVYTLSINPAGVGYTLITVIVSDGSMIGQSSFPYAASAMGRPSGRFHTMVSDGSTAFPINSDLMLVGDDENQTIRLYRRNESGPPLAAFDFTGDLNLTETYSDGRPKEMDIEASTHVGNRLFFLGSGSNAETGEAHPNRSRLFGADIVGTGLGSQLVYVGRYEYLKADIINWDVNNGHGKGANYYGLQASAAAGLSPKEEDGSGFNMEGLTMAPGSSHTAYVGLRAPYVPATNRAKALIVVVTNFDSLAVSDAGPGAARFGPPIELNLGRRGIRAMEAIPEGVLIVAGPAGLFVGRAPSDFKIFTWSGRPGDAPQKRGTDLSGLTPEGIVDVPPAPWTDTTQVQVISDNGTMEYYNDGVAAKHLTELAFKKFRSDWITLGPVVISQPVIRSWQPLGNQMALSWYSVEGLTYRVQFNTNLSATGWMDVPGDVLATDAISWKTLSPAHSGQAFYRVIVP